MKHETIRMMWKKYHERDGKQRAPLHTFKELAEELGVSMVVLRGKMKRADAPKPCLKFTSPPRSYYNPKEFHQWWKNLQDEEKNGGLEL